MAVGIIRIDTDLYNPYPTFTEYYKHELDEGVIQVFFSNKGEPISINRNSEITPYYDVSMSVTINDVIVVDNATISGSAVDANGRKGVAFSFKSLNVELFAGLMKIEFKITNMSDGYNIFSVSPIMLNITPSILDDASATPESVGSVSDMLMLNITPSILDNASATPESVGSVSELLQLYPDLKDMVDGGALRYNELSAPITSYAGFDNCSETGTMYIVSIAGTVASDIGTSGISWIIKVGSILHIEMWNSDQSFRCTYGDVENTIVEVVNPRISALENTVGTLNDQLETALNGGGS